MMWPTPVMPVFALADRRGVPPRVLYHFDPWYHKWVEQTRAFMLVHRMGHRADFESSLLRVQEMMLAPTGEMAAQLREFAHGPT